MKILILLCCLAVSFFVFSHDGHENHSLTIEAFQTKSNEEVQPGRPTTWLQWIGGFHLIILHFPIALINMLAVSELFLGWSKKPIFDFSSRFLLISALIFTPLTAILGLIYSYSSTYEGPMETFLLWHMWLGISTAVLTLVAALIREQEKYKRLYYTCLIAMFATVNLAGYFGGNMTFGPYLLYPPI
jgi:uncharacterized membrane protein